MIGQFITGSLINNSEPLDTAAVRNTEKSSVTHPAENATQNHLMVATTEPVTTERVTQSHMTVTNIDIITALSTLTASVAQINIPEERRSLPTAVMSDIGVIILTTGARIRTTGSAIVAEADHVMIIPTGHPRLQTMPSS